MAFENDPEGYAMAQRYAGADFDKPRTVTIEVFREYGGEEWTVAKFMSEISVASEKIPSQYMESARVVLEGDDGYSKLVVSYTGPELDSTVQDRIRRCEQYVNQARASERAQYEHLKAKFEG